MVGLRGWWVKSKIIADGSIDKALERRHYSRGMLLHKQTFEALFRFKRKLLEKESRLSFISKVKKLREEAMYANLPSLCNDENFI